MGDKMDDKNVVITEIWPLSTNVHPNGGIGISWAAKGIGFGEYVLFWGDDNKLHADTEYMDCGECKSFTREVLSALANEVIIDS